MMRSYGRTKGAPRRVSEEKRMVSAALFAFSSKWSDSEVKSGLGKPTDKCRKVYRDTLFGARAEARLEAAAKGDKGEREGKDGSRPRDLETQ
jgi:hypothetical protein